MIGDGLAYWRAFDQSARAYHRTRAGIGRATVKRGDDDKPIQLWQIEGYPSEIRDGIQRQQEVGLSTMPLPGAKVVLSYHGGQRSQGIIVGVEDPRYRPKGLKGGESQLYMIDEAGADGSGGKTRTVLQGLLGWIAKLMGKTIIIGSHDDTTAIDIYTSGTVTIHGDLHVTGTMTADHWQHKHGGIMAGDDMTDIPDQGTY